MTSPPRYCRPPVMADLHIIMSNVTETIVCRHITCHTSINGYLVARGSLSAASHHLTATYQRCPNTSCPTCKPSCRNRTTSLLGTGTALCCTSEPCREPGIVTKINKCHKYFAVDIEFSHFFSISSRINDIHTHKKQNKQKFSLDEKLWESFLK